MANGKKNNGKPTSTNGGKRGRPFEKGNPGGPGNPYAAQVAKFRKALYEAVTEQDITEIAHKMLEKAKRGDIHAANLVLDRLLGKPPQDLNLGNQGDKPFEVNIGGNLTEEEIRRIATAISVGSGKAK